MEKSVMNDLPNSIVLRTEDGHEFIAWGERPIEEAATDMLRDAISVLNSLEPIHEEGLDSGHH